MYTPIKTLSNGFFNNFNGIIQIRECFKACMYLTTIPDKIFEKLQASDINGCFSGCTSLTTIPNNLFNYLPGLTDITYAFSGCTSLQSIPEDLIQNSNITAFDGLFNGCTSLTGLTPKWEDGKELWEKEGTTGTDCFTGCTKLYNYPLIPEDWGGIQENYLVYQNAGPGSSIKIINDYSYVDSIRIIEGYQLYNIDMSNFNGYYITNTPYRYVYAEITVSDVPFTSIMFSGCTDLLKIPSKLYDSASGSLSMIIGDFEGCTNLRVIGKDLFASCTSLSDVGSIFDSCTSLKYIPSDLFRYNTSMQNFNSAFKNCTSLISSTPVDSNGNKLWQRNASNGYIDNIDGTDCFSGCENLLDWEEIPDDWKGQKSSTKHITLYPYAYYSDTSEYKTCLGLGLDPTSSSEIDNTIILVIRCNYGTNALSFTKNIQNLTQSNPTIVFEDIPIFYQGKYISGLKITVANTDIYTLDSIKKYTLHYDITLNNGNLFITQRKSGLPLLEDNPVDLVNPALDEIVVEFSNEKNVNHILTGTFTQTSGSFKLNMVFTGNQANIDLITYTPSTVSCLYSSNPTVSLIIKS